jgi:hypothetical protein
MIVPPIAATLISSFPRKRESSVVRQTATEFLLSAGTANLTKQILAVQQSPLLLTFEKSYTAVIRSPLRMGRADVEGRNSILVLECRAPVVPLA